MAVSHADHILQLQENLDRDEMPPQWMWPFVQEMNEWLDRIQSERRNRYNAPAASSDDDDMQENALLAGVGRR